MTFRSAKEIINDTEKGASELAIDAAEIIMDLDENSIEDYAVELLKGRPLMTPLVNLVNNIFLAEEKGDDIYKNVNNYLENLKLNKKESVNKVREIFSKNKYSSILTISYSSTVINSLENMNKVFVLESRPLMEGRKTSRMIKNDIKNEIEVEYCIDAAMAKAVKKTDVVLVGADTVCIEGVLNKMGTRPLFYTSKELSTPFYVVCDSSKILPSQIPISIEETHPAKEIWDTDLDININNDYFELTPWSDYDLIMEEGIEKNIEKRIKNLDVSDKLLKYHPKV